MLNELRERLRDWLKPKPPCRHQWRILIENYPTFTKDLWRCDRCRRSKVFENESPPVEIKTDICNLGHVHIINGRE